jgi:hypothetical protein
VTAPPDWFPGDPLPADVVVDPWWDEGGDVVSKGLRLPCVSDECATAMAAELAAQEVDATTDGRYVVVPTGGDPRLLYAVAELALGLKYAHDDEAAKAISDFLEAA